MKTCHHTGPYRVVQAMVGDRKASIVVICQGCGGYQNPWRHENLQWGSMKPTDPWFGTQPDLAAFPEGTALLLASDPLTDHAEAHALGMVLDRAFAVERHDAGWFVRHGEFPPWWEIKRDDASGDLLYRERAGWTPPAPDTRASTEETR